MSTGSAPPPPRPSGVRVVIGYNWPLYTGGLAAMAGGLALAPRLPRVPATLARTGALAAAALLVGSTAASWWVYDHSELYSLDWLTGLLPEGPGDHLVLSTGLDETSHPLALRYPGTRQTLVDLYDPALTTEGSIRRARRRVPPRSGTLAGAPSRIPVATASQDTAFAVFAAHELRLAPDREALFAEIARTLRPGGTLVLVEHLRDRANTAVFGPGAWHFMPRREWLRLARGAGLHSVCETRIANLVTAFSFRRGAE
ncbi:class I SAM-dependent methyltransferase [Streptomyces sp. NPDC059456]|uniref:class I SAM-dependent methyltransferase n=1 Tax=Streptomyces sp. NPDC059456 TaxID=3346838 RepID=UPI0036C3F0B3